MAQEVSHCLLTAEAWAQSQPSHMAYVVDKVSPAQDFLRVNLFSWPAPSHQLSVSVLPSSTTDDIHSLQITLLNNYLSLDLTHSLPPPLSLSVNAFSIHARFYFISHGEGSVCFEDYWWLWATSLQASIKIFFSSIHMRRLILRCAHQHMKVLESV